MRRQPLLARTLVLAVPLYLASLAVSLVGTVLATVGLALVAGNRPWLPDLLGPGWLNTVGELLASLGEAPTGDRVAVVLVAASAVIWPPILVALQWLAYTFVAGGILERLLFDRAGPSVSPSFWQSCRRWFWPFARLGVIGFLFGGALTTLGAVGAFYLADLTGSTAAFLLWSVWLALLLGWLEIGRAAMVWHGERTARSALRRAIVLLARPVPILHWLLLALPGVGLLLLGTNPPTGGGISAGAALWTLAVGQVYALLGAWLKVIRLAAASRLVATAGWRPAR